MFAIPFCLFIAKRRWVVKSLKAKGKQPASTSKRLCVYGKLGRKIMQRKCPTIKAKETTLTLGQFVEARMGGDLPQYIVSQIY